MDSVSVCWIADKESLYARVLMSFITEHELHVRRELERQLAAARGDREYRARLLHFARAAPLERLLALYEQNRFAHGRSVKPREEA